MAAAPPTHTNQTIPAFTPMELTYEIVNAYSTAFLGLYLKGETAPSRSRLRRVKVTEPRP